MRFNSAFKGLLTFSRNTGIRFTESVILSRSAVSEVQGGTHSAPWYFDIISLSMFNNLLN